MSCCHISGANILSISFGKETKVAVPVVTFEEEDELEDFEDTIE